MDKIKIELQDLEGELRDIAERIGIEAFRTLVQDFGGAYFYIPLKRNITKYRRRAVKILYSEGKSIKQIASQLGCAINTVRRDLRTKD